jgi:hypothetical protein
MLVRRWTAWPILLLPSLVFVLSLRWMQDFYASHPTLGLFLPLVLMLTAIIVSEELLVDIARPYIRMNLPGYCPQCGYSLTGNISGVCPECGGKVNPGPLAR